MAKGEDLNASWTVRVGRTRLAPVRVRTRAHGFDVAQSLDFGAKAEATSALEAFLGSLGADVVLQFTDLCDRRRLLLDQIEAKVEGRLGNALVALGVVGEEGDPGLSDVRLTVLLASPADPDDLRAAWDEALRRSPLVATLGRSVTLTCELKLL